MTDAPPLAAPAAHGELLITPGADVLRAALQRPAGGLDVPLLNTTIATLRAELRTQLGLTAAPVVLTGHQVEFFHAGVLAKTLAVHALARGGAQGVFLIADADVPKHRELIVPALGDRGLERLPVPLPGVDPLRPVEDQPPASLAEWADVFHVVRTALRNYDDALMPTFADAWLDAPDEPVQFCDAFSRARMAAEAALGLDDLHQVRLSALCSTRAFRAFVAHLLLHAPQAAADYNAAQAEYRARHHVHSPLRPVPPLAVEGTRVETPFWAHRAGAPRRRLFVSDVSATLRLDAEGTPIGELSRTHAADAASHAAPWELEVAGWHVRPRALTVSGFARLFLTDLFIHGIGGAKYDQITDGFLTRLLGVTPPPLACVSATLLLPLPWYGVTPARLEAARRAARDVRYNPQKHLPRLPADRLERLRILIAESDRLRAADPHDRARRRLVFDELHTLHADLRALRLDDADAIEHRVQTLVRQQAHDRIARDREYFFALHPRDALQDLATRVRAALGP